MSNTTKAVLLGFYGDGFPGSTDVGEVTAFAGLRTIEIDRIRKSIETAFEYAA